MSNRVLRQIVQRTEYYKDRVIVCLHDISEAEMWRKRPYERPIGDMTLDFGKHLLKRFRTCANPIVTTPHELKSRWRLSREFLTGYLDASVRVASDVANEIASNNRVFCQISYEEDGSTFQAVIFDYLVETYVQTIAQAEAIMRRTKLYDSELRVSEPR